MSGCTMQGLFDRELDYPATFQSTAVVHTRIVAC